MDELNYLIMNPLQLTIIYKKKNKITEIEERFYNKMEELKTISLKNNGFKKYIKNSYT